jgi:hypothetical protein
LLIKAFFIENIPLFSETPQYGVYRLAPEFFYSLVLIHLDEAKSYRYEDKIKAIVVPID